MTAIRRQRAQYNDLYTEPPMTVPPSSRELELARRVVARVAFDEDDHAMLLEALGLSVPAPAGTGPQADAAGRPCA